MPQAAALDATVANDGDLAVGVVFLPQDGAAQARRTLKGALHDCGLTVLGWRETPIDASIIGDQALATLPCIEHVLVTWPDAPSNEAFTSWLFLARKIAERRLAAEESACYIASLSNRLIVYKGMLVAPQLQTFYNGMHLLLDGEANDYVGKGMHGGELVVRPPVGAQFHPHDNVIVGNTVLYGATGGSMFASGRAGERFGVRNSGAWAVVEGAGAHACEYMTGGVVVILGPTGRNLGAGMSGGMAFVLDINNDTDTMINPEMVGAEPVDDQHDEEILQALVTRHHELTHSPRAEDVLSNWAAYLPLFKKVSPLPHVAPPVPRERQRARRNALDGLERPPSLVPLGLLRRGSLRLDS